ncbi:hypothetical protein JHK85_017864 [Glycine max]|nr:hypothetical protein JHK85_017864 [Glycine max]
MDDGGCRLRFRWEQCPLSDFFRTDELPNVEDAVRILQGAEVVAATFPWRSCCHHRAKHVWLAHASHRSFCSSTKTLIEVTVGAYTNRSHPWTVIPLGVPGATNLLFDLDQALQPSSTAIYMYDISPPKQFSKALLYLFGLLRFGLSQFAYSAGAKAGHLFLGPLIVFDEP